MEARPLTEAPADLLKRIEALEAEVVALRAAQPDDLACILVLNGQMEQVQTALMIAIAAASMGLEVKMLFAMWGIQALRRSSIPAGKSAMGRWMGAFLADDISQMPSSRLNLGGIGPRIFAKVMASKSIQTPAELMDLAPQLGIEMAVCPNSLDMFELTLEEMRPGLSVAGAASFVETSSRAKFSIVF